MKQNLIFFPASMVLYINDSFIKVYTFMALQEKAI